MNLMAILSIAFHYTRFEASPFVVNSLAGAVAPAFFNHPLKPSLPNPGTSGLECTKELKIFNNKRYF